MAPLDLLDLLQPECGEPMQQRDAETGRERRAGDPLFLGHPVYFLAVPGWRDLAPTNGRAEYALTRSRLRPQGQRVRGKPRSTLEVPGSGQREVMTFERV